MVIGSPGMMIGAIMSQKASLPPVDDQDDDEVADDDDKGEGADENPNESTIGISDPSTTHFNEGESVINVSIDFSTSQKF